MRRHLIFITGLIISTLSLLLNNYASAEVYKTVDKNGRVTYTDVPPKDASAKPIELKSINTIPAPENLPPADTNNPNKPTAQEAAAYNVQILAPENGTTLLANERSITA